MPDPNLLGLVAAGISALAAALSIGVAFYVHRQSEKLGKAQYRVAALGQASSWLGDFRGWASAAVDVLSRAEYGMAQFTTAGDRGNSNDCACELSALIDRGRFFLPNIPQEDVGSGKPSAYQGYRHPILDPLVAAERVLTAKADPASHGSAKDAILNMRREFVSSVQRVLGPEHHNKAIAEVIRELSSGRAADRSLGGLLPADGALPRGAHALLAENRYPRPPASPRS